MKVFLSSTYVDLVEYRAKAASAIERLGQQGVRMEVFGSRPSDAESVCMEEMESCDAIVGIYAHRYGFIPKESEVSITEQEFDFAQANSKPIFCFVVDHDFPWIPRMMEGEPGHSKLQLFKEKITKSVVYDTFTTPEDLGFKVASSLGRFLIMQKIKDELAELPAAELVVSSADGRDQVARRAARLQDIISGSRILLVNDAPNEMANVISILRDLGMDVQVATNTDNAMSMLLVNTDDIHAVVSDMKRGAVEDEGIHFLKRMRVEGIAKPTIFTVGLYDPTRGVPPFAFGITNRVDELLNLLFDVLERVRG